MFNTTPLANRYKVGKLIGQGGMGSVFQGTDIQTDAPVAIKYLKREVVADNPDMLRRFEQEGEALRVLNHPNIVKMLDTVTEGEDHYLIMEYVPGGSLRDVLDTDDHFSVQRALYVALDLADALTRAHRLNIIHRDIKPANVLLAEDGTPRLTDFGVAHVGSAPRVTQDNAVVGTLAYLAPEAFEGGVANARTDIWAFGILLYEMLIGKLPFEDTHISTLITSILTAPIPNLETMRPDIPIGLVDLVHRMLEKDPNQRIPSVRLVGAELEAVIRGDARVVAPRMPLSTRFDTPPAARTSEVMKRHHHNLPAQTTPFVGRDVELAEIADLLHSPDQRLITLIAPGGMGKTRLGIEVGQQALNQFEHGVFFVPLAPLSETGQIVPEIASNIEFEFGGQAEPKDQLLDYLREKQMLLILDNFEHLISGASIVGDILRAAPDVQIITTSRERLRLQGERVYDVPGMTFPDWETPEELNEFSAVRLFMQSARRVQPDFEINKDTAPCVARITRLVQGMPLGIELAAAWLEVLSPSEIVSEIEKSFDFLETDLQDVPERHRSLRAVFEYSWNLLAQDEREVLAQLAVFRGGFSREAAMAVTGAALRTLTALVNKSLLRRAPDGRYELHIQIQQFAAEALDATPAVAAAVKAKHAEFYIAYVTMREEEMQAEQQKRRTDELTGELENIRAALFESIASNKPEAVDRVRWPLLWYYEFTSTPRNGVKLFEQLLAALHKHGVKNDDLMALRLRSMVVGLNIRIGIYDNQRQTMETILGQLRHYDDTEAEVYGLNNLCYVCMMTGEYDASVDYGKAACDLSQAIPNPALRAIAVGNLGYVHYLRGELEQAKQHYETLLDGSTFVNMSGVGLAYYNNNMGEILRAMGQHQRAQQCFEDAYSRFKAIEHQRGMAFSLNNLGGVLFGEGRINEAEEKYRQSYRLNRDIGDRWGTGHSLSALGNIALLKGDNDEAQRYYQESLALRQSMGDKRTIADSLTDLGDVAGAKGQLDEAERLYAQALELRREIGDPQGEAYALIALAWAKVATSELDLALAYSQQALDIVEAINAIFGLFQIVAMRGAIYLEREEYQAAEAAATRLFDMAETYDAPIGHLMAHNIQGFVHISRDEFDRAASCFRQSLEMSQSDNRPLIASLPLLGTAHLFALQGRAERAVEIITSVNTHNPAAMYSIAIQSVKRRLKQLEAKMQPAAYAAAVERGKQQSLEQVVVEVLHDDI